MALLDDLLELETGFWTGDADFYRQHVDDPCLLAFPSMAGALSVEEVAATIGEGPRWERPHLEIKGLIQPEDRFALLTYQASTRGPDGEPYSALVSSGYVQRQAGWKLAFHQHTPIPAET